MGNIILRSRILESMNNFEHSEDADGEFELLRDRVFNDIQINDEDDSTHGSGFEFASILRHLIRSGEIMVLNYESYMHHPLPVIKRKPNLDRLKHNDLYHSTKCASGAKDDPVSGGSSGASGSGAAGTSATPAASSAAFSMMRMITQRQQGLGKRQAGSFEPSEMCRITNHFLPNTFTDTVSAFDTKVFCGKFTSNGDRFVTASQDTWVRVYDSTRSQYKLLRLLDTKHVSWSILDMDFSPDGQSFVYSTWADALFISSMDRSVSDTFHSLYLSPNNQKVGVFTVCYSGCGKHILCGANDGILYSYDLEANRRTLMAPVARLDTDVNTVGYVEEVSNIFYSGSDDGIIKLWDRRCIDESDPLPVGRLIGHFDGVTYIDSRNDGRYIISNSKDQSIKLWDLRKMSPSYARQEHVPNSWDYRWDEVPKRFFNVKKAQKGDTSIMTYRGHKVQKSLIRAKFSPASTTGQRYIYTGCGTGRLIIYDVLTGKIVQAIEGHHDIVRDVAWHPHRTEIITCSWDSTVHRHTYCNPIEQQEQRERLRELKNARPSSYSHRSNDDAESDSEMSEQPPVRRSRRLAERYSHAEERYSSSSSSSNSSSSSSSINASGGAGAAGAGGSRNSSRRSSSSGRISRNRNASASRQRDCGNNVLPVRLRSRRDSP